MAALFDDQEELKNYLNIDEQVATVESFNNEVIFETKSDIIIEVPEKNNNNKSSARN
jgi:hypothetical protein